MMKSIIISVFGLSTCAPIEFVAFGDWGHKGAGLLQTVKILDKTSPNRDFTVLLGDNFYPAGVKSTKDKKFKLFTDFVAKNTGRGKRHFVVLGNHDWIGNAQAQIQYSKVNSDWYLPATYYYEVIQKEGIVLCLVFTDTSHMDNKQIAWIDQVLAYPVCANPASWRIVSGHFPIYSAGMYSDNAEMKEKLVPILHKHKVHIHLAGHEHLQSVFDDGKLTTIVSGSVGLSRSKRKWRKHEFMVWGINGKKSTGFAHFIVSQDRIQLNFISSFSGKALSQFQIDKTGSPLITLAADPLTDVSDSSLANCHAFSPVLLVVALFSIVLLYFDLLCIYRKKHSLLS